MFYTLRRMLGIGLLLIFAGSAALIYHRRAAFAPIGDLLWIHQNRQPATSLPEMEGKVVAALDGAWLHVEPPSGKIVAVRISEVPATGNSRTLFYLLESAVGQTVRVQIQSAARLDLCEGHVFLNRTNNVGLQLVRLGLAPVNRPQIRQLSFEEQYAFLSAERQARARPPRATVPGR